ncbi:hypothetical protein J4573_02515 [Actinomadura barringtoniae]|uniref:Uncharacterized protein n=1 Tax=Actinomadura barringtoniae TaxID=1427535 RepID=A0A939P9Q6_9ACTN|nr:hypothetical protein [Actinomadura barringtoniae]MBO2445953.1 hypothetical protein [Actinomadura barringtoniae]
MKPKISIVVMVDAVGALSDQTLHNGNLSLVDDSPFHSHHQGTPNLATAVMPGQVVKWTPIAVDVQTPVEIQGIAFLGPDGRTTAEPYGSMSTDHPGPAAHQPAGALADSMAGYPAGQPGLAAPPPAPALTTGDPAPTLPGHAGAATLHGGHAGPAGQPGQAGLAGPGGPGGLAGPGGQAGTATLQGAPAAYEVAPSDEPEPAAGHENLDLLVWEGTVPFHMVPNIPYRYRLTVKLHEGPNSVMHIDSPALVRV